ncbi:methyltransferase domain-containing protein [Candidatus Woesearchaeota archaeon]|nr:methyltransferase domain-containing protein [Candidatus Woesearchaeota archaeon]
MAYYDVIAKGYNELHRGEQLNKLSIIKENIKINKNTKILDVGCGTGISSGFECFVAGIDPSIGLLRQNKNGKKILGAAESLPFKANSFDYVISVTAIHSFKNIRKSMEEMKRVGKGNFVFSILKKSGKFGYIKKMIEEKFRIWKAVEEGKDTIFFCRAKSLE